MKTETGFTLADGYAYRQPRSYALIEDHDFPYRAVWFHAETMQVLTYCEGDLVRETCESEEELRAHLDRLRAFYHGLIEDAIPAKWGGELREAA